jgi:hypothetical protein
LAALLVRLVLRTFDADRAAFFPVVFFGALRCDSALAAALFDFRPVDRLRSVFDAALAAFRLVTFDRTIRPPELCQPSNSLLS